MNYGRDNEWLGLARRSHRSDRSAHPHRHHPESLLPGGGRQNLPRGLRLALATGALLAGFGLVIGMVALALAAGGAPVPGAPVPGASAASHPRTSSAAHASPTPSPLHFQPGAILTSLHGTGTQSSRAFHVPSPGTWGLAWSYYGCPDNDPGVFTVGETRTTADHSLRITGSAGSDHGTTWFRDDPGWHSVVIVSRCSWRLKIVTPRPEQPSGGNSSSSSGSGDSPSLSGRGDSRSHSPHHDSNGHHDSPRPSPSGGPSGSGRHSPSSGTDGGTSH